MTVSGSSFPLASGVLHLALNQARPSGAAVCESAPWLCHREDHPSGAAVCESAPWRYHREEHPSGAAVCENAPWHCHKEDHPSGDTVCVRVLLGAATGRTIPQGWCV